jgi:hypothetical protein
MQRVACMRCDDVPATRDHDPDFPLCMNCHCTLDVCSGCSSSLTEDAYDEGQNEESESEENSTEDEEATNSWDDDSDANDSTVVVDRPRKRRRVRCDMLRHCRCALCMHSSGVSRSSSSTSGIPCVGGCFVVLPLTYNNNVTSRRLADMCRVCLFTRCWVCRRSRHNEASRLETIQCNDCAKPRLDVIHDVLEDEVPHVIGQLIIDYLAPGARVLVHDQYLRSNHSASDIVSALFN